MELGESTVGSTTTATPAATTSLVGLAEVYTEGTNLEEIDVALGGAAVRPPVAVLHLGVVGNEVTGLEAEILEKERVRTGNLRCRGPIEQPNRVLGATVDRVDKKQLGDAVVVVGFHFDIKFLDRTRVLIAPRPRKRHRRWLILQDVDRVFGRGRHESSACPLQSDFVVPFTLDGQARRPRAIPLVCEYHGLTVDEELPARGKHRWEDSQPHYGPSDRGDITSEFDRARREPCVCGEVILQVEMLYIGEIGHLDSVCFRVSALGFDVVVRVLVHTEKEELEALSSVGEHGQPVEPVRGLPAEEDPCLSGRKSLELGCDELIGSSGNRDVTGTHRNRIRVHRAGVPRREQEGGCPAAELSGSQEQ